MPIQCRVVTDRLQLDLERYRRLKLVQMMSGLYRMAALHITDNEVIWSCD